MIAAVLATTSFPRDPAAMPHHEIELKWALSAAAHAALGGRLRGLLGMPVERRQENRFFDTADRRLRRSLVNLRLRREGEAVLLTCKHRTGTAEEVAGGLARHVEWEEWLSPELAARTAAEPVAAWIGALPLPPIVVQALDGAVPEALGGFANHRLEFALDRDGLGELLCLDRTDYGARVDHELEIETDDPPATAAHWQGLLAAWDIPWQPQPTSKFVRYLEMAGVR